MPSGRGITVWHYHLLHNTYAPTGSSRRSDREFFTTDLTCLLRQVPQNYVLEENASNKALDTLLRNVDLTDAWTNEKDRPIYRHYRSHGASSVDRVYMSASPARHKQGTEILAAAFTDDEGRATITVLQREALNSMASLSKGHNCMWKNDKRSLLSFTAGLLYRLWQKSHNYLFQILER